MSEQQISDSNLDTDEPIVSESNKYINASVFIFFALISLFISGYILVMVVSTCKQYHRVKEYECNN